VYLTPEPEGSEFEPPIDRRLATLSKTANYLDYSTKVSQLTLSHSQSLSVTLDKSVQTKTTKRRHHFPLPASRTARELRMA